MSKEKFRIGDRVAVYGGIANVPSKQDRKLGVIEEVLPEDLFGIRFDDYWDGDKFWYVHPKQCRRIVKKTKPRRPEIYITKDSLAHVEALGCSPVSASKVRAVPGDLRFVLAKGEVL